MPVGVIVDEGGAHSVQFWLGCKGELFTVQ